MMCKILEFDEQCKFVDILERIFCAPSEQISDYDASNNPVSTTIYRGYCMSSHVLLNLLNLL